MMAVRDLPNLTEIRFQHGQKTLLYAQLPTPSRPEQLAALGDLFNALSTWLDAPLAVVLHVSPRDPSWWAWFDAPTGLALSGTCYECSIVVDEPPELGTTGTGDTP
jgi:hypothetical protein